MSKYDELVRRAQTGDVRAFNEIVLRFQDMAVGYAHAILCDFHQAEDAAQDAFLDVYRLLSQLEEPSAFPGWLRRIIFKHCDRFTRKKYLPTVPIDMALEIPVGRTPLDDMEEREQKRFVLNTIQALSETDRTVLTLYYISEYTQQEVAVFLDLSVSQVNNRLRHARRRIKERMLDMVKDTLHENAPSQDDAFLNKVSLHNAARAGDEERVLYILERAPELANQDIDMVFPIQYAAIHGHTGIVRMLMDHGADPTQGMGHGVPDSALELARERGYTDILEMIQEKLKGDFEYCEIQSSIFDFIEQDRLEQFLAYLKVDPASARCADDNGNTPLHYVVEHNRVSMAKPLVDHGADINAANVRGARAIHWAIEFGNALMTGLLVGLGAEYELGVAAACGDTTFVRDVLAKDPSLAIWADANGFHAVTRAAQNGHVETVKAFLEYPIPFKNARETMDTEPTYKTLSSASAGGHLDVVRLLLDHGADVDEVHYYRSGWEYVKDGVVVDVGSPLFVAATNGHIDIVRLLLEHDATPDAYIDSTGTPIKSAMWNGHLDIVNFLIDRGAELDLNNRMRIARSNGQNDLAMLEEALQRDTDLDCMEWLNNWAARGRADLLRIAFKHNRLKLSEDHGVIDSSVRPVNEIYPEEGDRVEAARFLLDHGVDAEGVNEENRSYLHHFPRTVHWYDRYLEVAELVIDHGADVNRREKQQNLTPLSWAVKWNNLDYARLLLEKGAKPNLPDDPPGITPLAIAQNKRFMEMAALLEEFGATA